MTAIDQFLVHVAFTQMATCCVLLAPMWRKNQSIFLFSLLLLCGCGYHLSDVFGPVTRMTPLWWLDYLSGNALPGVFWLVSLSVFADGRELRPWQYWLASMTLVIPLVATLLQLTFSFDLREYPAFFGLVTYGAMTLELVLICYALVVAIRHWQADLVEERRLMRGSIIAVTGVYLFGVIIVEQLFNLQWQWLATVEYALLCLLMLGITALLFSLRQSTLFDPPKDQPIPPKPEPQPSSPELESILHAMQEEKLYREEGMTISKLSRHLVIHEYRLRKLINGELAYRNFNDFLNFFRIQEVTEKLVQPDSKDLPVLTLALESGFRSLSSFNKAFKNQHGMTPTEYRHSARANPQKT